MHITSLTLTVHHVLNPCLQVEHNEAGVQEALEKLGGSESMLQGLRGKVKGADAKLQVRSA